MTDVPIPEGPAEPPPSGGGLLYRLQPLLTLVIAIAAITLAVWEGLENRRHNRLTVQPRLGAAIDAGRNAEGEYVRMAIESNGLGPAVLTRFQVYFDGVAQDTTSSGMTSWSNVVAQFQQMGDGLDINAQGFGVGTYLPAGEEGVVFEMKRARTPGAPPLTEALDRVAVHVCYCSIYGSDCGEFVLAMTEPEEVERCYR